MHLLYPTLPDELRPERRQGGARATCTEVSTIRRMLGTIEHQVAPTAFSVQLTERRTPCAARWAASSCSATPPTPPSRPGLLSGEYEPHLTAVFERYCTPGMTVVDVGANLGYYSLLASQPGRTVGPGHRPGAELRELPAPAVVAATERTSRTSSCCPVAADTATGLGLLLDARRLQRRPDRRRGPPVPSRASSSRPSGSTTSSTGPVGLLKMDVEGAEGRVVQGATRIIERDRPIVTTELKDEMLRRVSGTTVAEYLGVLREARLHAVAPGEGHRSGEALRLGGRAARRLGRDRRAARRPAPARSTLNGRTSQPLPLVAVRIRIEGHDLPGRSCGPGPTIPTGTPTCTSRCSAGASRTSCSGLVRGDAAERRRGRSSAPPPTRPTGVDLKGPYIQGPARRQLRLPLLGRGRRGRGLHHVPAGQAHGWTAFRRMCCARRA